MVRFAARPLGGLLEDNWLTIVEPKRKLLALLLKQP